MKVADGEEGDPNALCWENDSGFSGLPLLIMELPRKDEGGGSVGVNDPVDEGGGPAGVVEGFEAPNGKLLLPLLDLLSGVDGGLDEYGTWKVIVSSMLRRAVPGKEQWVCNDVGLGLKNSS
jgi:hypothetical protein